MMSQILIRDQDTQKTLAEHDLLLKNHQSSFQDLQRVVGDMARKLEERLPGQFAGNTQQNPNAHVKSITTRSGRTVENPRGEERVEVEEEENVDEEIEMEAPGKVQQRLSPASTAQTGEPQREKNVEKPPVDFRPSPLVDHSRVPFPSRLRNQKYSREYSQFLDIFKQLKINLPFIEALQHMPKYAKFLKDLLKRKDKLGEVSNVPLTGGCAAVILNQLPEKLTDPGVFTIPCLFGGTITPVNALADLGASINLMPFSLYEKLGLGELTPTRMSLSLADRSVKYPRGVIENLLVKVDQFVFPVDFVVLDMEADERVPIILGRPFLRTAKAIIDVHEGHIQLRAGDEKIIFEIDRSVQHSRGVGGDSGPGHSVYLIESFTSGDDHSSEEEGGAGLVKEAEKIRGPMESLEEEFGEELVDIPTLVDVEFFDPAGDLAELEALLNGEPAVGVKESSKEQEEEVVKEAEEIRGPMESLEEEFGEELVDLPALVNEELFDPAIDLAELEVLINGKPTLEIGGSSEEQKGCKVYQELLVKEVDVEEELDLRNSLGSLFDDEVEVEEEKRVLNWEEEFLGELEGLPEYEQVGEFDPLGDLENLEALLEDKPEKISEPTPQEEIKCGDLPEEAMVVVEEEHHNWPVNMTEDEPHSSARLGERATSSEEPGRRGRLIMQRLFSERETTPLTYTHESSHYMHLINFLPGKFDYWWFDSLRNYNCYCNSTGVRFLRNELGQVELSRLEVVQIKEKPH